MIHFFIQLLLGYPLCGRNSRRDEGRTSNRHQRDGAPPRAQVYTHTPV